MSFEYTVIPAPIRTKRQKGVKTAVERLAYALEEVINDMAADGWEYLRTETMTVEDKAGRFSKIVEKIETVLVFRRTAQARPARVAPVQEAQAMKAEPVAEAAPVAAPSPKAEEPQMMKRAADEVDGKAPSLGGVSRD